MSDLLFYAVLAALLYYFFYYLPAQKSRPVSLTSTATQFTQTDPEIIGPEAISIPDPAELARLSQDNQQKERTIIGLNESYNKLTKLTQAQTTEAQQTEQTLDTLLKNITKLSEKL